MRRLRGLVFDLDGTLVDSRHHILAYNQDLFTALGRPFPHDRAHLFYTLDRDALEREFFAPEDMPAVDAFRRAQPYNNRLHEIVALPLADSVLQQAAQQVARRALLTNRGSSTRPLLEQLGWAAHFDPVISAVDVLYPKPDPEGLLKIAEDWALDPHELAFVGDSDVDVACARAGGALAVYVGPETPPPGADVALRTLTDVAAWLAAQRWAESRRPGRDA